MRPFWHPVSALLLADPPTFVAPSLLAMLLRAEGRVDLRYAGDRMSPAVKQGMAFRAVPVGKRGFARGEAVVAAPAGIPDLYRIDLVDTERVTLGADADPHESTRAPLNAVLARTELRPRRETRARRGLRRLGLDMIEALRQGPDRADDPASTVRDKYDGQATFYSAAAGPSLDQALLARVRNVTQSGERVLVVGSGTGCDCFALAEMGLVAVGLDFAPAMVRIAREEAARRDASATFIEGDLRHIEFEPASLAAVVFTYDVYSFVPSRRERVEALRRLVGALQPGGRIFLSARRVRRAWDRWILTLLRWNGRSASKEWGAAHTRYVTSDGKLRRAFVGVFTDSQLREETCAAGLAGGAWVGGHGEYRPAEAEKR